jgi:hypothetical protein
VDKSVMDLGRGECVQVREIGLYYTCWWYSLCNLEY